MISTFDIIGGIAVAILAGLGVRAGFLSSLLSIFAVFISVGMASNFSSWAAKNFAFIGAEKNFSYSLIFVFLFLVIYIIAEMLVWLIKKIITVKLLGVLDSIAAALLGGLKALLIIGILLDLTSGFTLPKESQAALDRSYIKGISSKVLQTVYPLAKSTLPKVEKLINGTKEEKKKVEQEVKNKTKLNPQIEEILNDPVKTVTTEASKAVRRFTP